MRRPILALFSAVVVLASGMTRADAAALRHLSFFVTLDDYTTTSHTILGAMGGEEGVGPAGGVVHTTGSAVVSVDVMQVFADAGLLVNVSETANGATSGPLSVGLAADGSIVGAADAVGALTAEERALLPMLASRVVAGQDVTAGNAWTFESPTKDEARSLAVSVTSVDGDLAKLTFNSKETGKDLGGTRSEFAADVTYALKRTVPTAIVLRGVTTSDTGDTKREIRLHATYALRDDSMGEHL